MTVRPAEDRRRSSLLWAAGLVFLALLVSRIGALFWYLPYDHRPDQDVVLAYNALLLNAGLPQEYFGHSGYVFIILLTAWTWLLHLLGLLPVHALSELPPFVDQPAYIAAWQEIIEAGRVLTTAIMAAFTVTFAWLTAKLFDDRRFGFLAGLALATAAGTVSQIGLLRTEPLSSAFTVTALLLVAVVAAGRIPERRFLALGVAACFAVTAVETKVFAFLSLVFAPLVALAFGPPAAHAPDAEPVRRRRAAVLGVAALVLAIPAGVIVWIGLSKGSQSLYEYRPLGAGPLKYYHLLLPVWIFAGLAACSALWKTPSSHAVSAGAAIVIGASLGFGVLLIRPELQNIIVTTHPLEHLFVFSTWSDHSLETKPTVLSGAILAKLAKAAAAVVKTRFAHPLSDNLFLLEWFAALGMLFGFRGPGRRWIAQASLLLILSLALQAIFLLRYPSKIYHVYSDPFTILAAAVVLNRFRAILDAKIGAAIVLIGVSCYGLWGLKMAVRQSGLGRADPAEICAAHAEYLARLEVFPFCEPD